MFLNGAVNCLARRRAVQGALRDDRLLLATPGVRVNAAKGLPAIRHGDVGHLSANAEVSNDQWGIRCHVRRYGVESPEMHPGIAGSQR